MTDLVTTFRATQLAGVTRAEFQEKIHSGELKTFEGKIHLDDLKKVFPDVRQDRNAEAERARMEKIKSSASYQSKQSRRQSLPDPETLMKHLQTLSDKSMKIKSELDISETLVATLADRLSEICSHDEECMKEEIETLYHWLCLEKDKSS